VLVGEKVTVAAVVVGVSVTVDAVVVGDMVTVVAATTTVTDVVTVTD